MNIFIIEHPTRGALRPDSIPGLNEWHWSTTGMRNDSDKTWIFRDINRARTVFSLLPEKVKKQAKIMQYLKTRPENHPDGNWKFPQYVEVT